jgi:ketosteroid isomerase-like protein
MVMNTGCVVLACAVSIGLFGCTTARYELKDLVDNPFLGQQSEIRAAVMSIKSDIESSNIDGLQAAHLESDKFTKFGPRIFERQDVANTNKTEAAFFGALTHTNYEVRDLKIDVFGDVGIATYYPDVSFVRDGRSVKAGGRQTLVFVRTESGWKIVHEHGTARVP